MSQPMDEQAPENQTATPPGGGPIERWQNIPLYGRIVIALVLGIITGLLLGSNAASLAVPGKLVLRLLGALAPALILAAIVHTFMTTRLGGPLAVRLPRLLVLNTLVAITVGLTVANVVQPGQGAGLTPPSLHEETTRSANPLTLFLENVPKSLLGPLGDDGKVIGVIFVAVAFGMALRKERERPIMTIGHLVELFLEVLIKILHWIIAVVPLAVFGIVASIIGTEGFAQFRALGIFVLSVLLALVIQAAYYLVRIRFGSWVSPRQLLRGGRDALVMAFSTASSTATMPVTYAALKDRVGLREQSASMGALVGANFNNDGTALYEAMAALFVAQMIGMDLSIQQQLMVVLTSIIASVGAAGIPEAGLVTMTMVFTAVGLPVQYIPVLLTVDWFLDRCRTAINVMGDMNVSCLLDGKQKEETS
ncbi:MAG: sodium:dicarboxylate symporter [Nitrospira sp. HN-bin3]|uniref:dicarboxylate/amino acid:cation symporter n=1 Tax=Nitrospira cf. moscoviensis SBR1015 TaxID=96242 RepID=UPI000A0C4EC7|nr:dicarboxylate/amino acid:cation symporter [Nitrospira cf. moscoviensis SBR1015]OQW42044.1 MAG: sodium:dicarboxylate symporter [Nitrospira sp. HN-bin3]